MGIYEVEECEYEGTADATWRSYNSTIVLSIPLHDAKVHVRLKAQNELHCFYKQIIKRLKPGGLEDTIIEESPNLRQLGGFSDEEIPF